MEAESTSRFRNGPVEVGVIGVWLRLR